MLFKTRMLITVYVVDAVNGIRRPVEVYRLCVSSGINDRRKLNRRMRSRRINIPLLKYGKKITMLETIISCHVPKVAFGLVLTLWQSLCGFPCCFDLIA